MFNRRNCNQQNYQSVELSIRRILIKNFTNQVNAGQEHAGQEYADQGKC